VATAVVAKNVVAKNVVAWNVVVTRGVATGGVANGIVANRAVIPGRSTSNYLRPASGSSAPATGGTDRPGRVPGDAADARDPVA